MNVAMSFCDVINSIMMLFTYVMYVHMLCMLCMFIYAINSIRKSVRLAQLVEQWTGNPEVGGSSPPSNPLIFGCVKNSY